MTEPIKITIIHEVPTNYWRIAKGYAFTFGFIGIGVAVGSSAMQWMGFLVTAIGGITFAMVSARKHIGISIPDARKRLDEIERTGI